MKIFILPVLLLVSQTSFSQSAPCNGGLGKMHINPDGSNGGFVARTASVAKESYLSSDSEVCDKVIVKGKAIIENGSRIEEQALINGGAVIRDSHIYGLAQIKGASIIQESEVCQGSVIEGLKIIKSNYYCQTEDPEPKDPGEDNFKSLLGIDSDADGVRDDVERFINRLISNSQKQNRAQDRIAAKLLAKIIQKEILLKSNVPALKSLYYERSNLVDCYNITANDDIFLEMYDTEERVLALTKIAGVTHGEEPVPFSKNNCKSLDAFRSSINAILGNK